MDCMSLCGNADTACEISIIWLFVFIYLLIRHCLKVKHDILPLLREWKLKWCHHLLTLFLIQTWCLNFLCGTKCMINVSVASFAYDTIKSLSSNSKNIVKVFHMMSILKLYQNRTCWTIIKYFFFVTVPVTVNLLHICTLTEYFHFENLIPNFNLVQLVLEVKKKCAGVLTFDSTCQIFLPRLTAHARINITSLFSRWTTIFNVSALL